MGLLRLNVLGQPEVLHNGNRLTFPLQKAQALLLYLAIEGGMHSRSKLAAFLWPDSETPVARKALRNALALLRRLLAEPNSSPDQHSHLLSEGDLLGLDQRVPLEMDLHAVQDTWKEVQLLTTSLSEEQGEIIVTHAQHTLAMVRGPFLDGFWPARMPPLMSGSSSTGSSGRCACRCSSIVSRPGRRKPGSRNRPKRPWYSGWRSTHSRRRPTGA